MRFSSIISLASLVAFGAAEGYAKQSKACLTQKEGEELMKKWVRIFEGGVDDNLAKKSRALLADNFQYFSQSQLYLNNGGPGVHQYIGEDAPGPFDNFPPHYASPDAMIEANKLPNFPQFYPDLLKTGPVLISCHGFTFRWQWDFEKNMGLPPQNKGRVYGIDMVMMNDDNKIVEAHSEFNTLNNVWIFGAHPTAEDWAKCPLPI